MKILKNCETIRKKTGIFKFFEELFKAIHNFEILAIIGLYFALGIGIGYSFLINKAFLLIILGISLLFFYFCRNRFFIFLSVLILGIFNMYFSEFFNIKFYDKNEIRNLIIEGIVDNIKASRYRDYVIISDVNNPYIDCDKIKLQKDKGFFLDSKIGDKVILRINLRQFEYSDQRFLYYNRVNGICATGKVMEVISSDSKLSANRNIFSSLIKKFRKRIYNHVIENDKSSGSGILLALTIGNTGFIKKHDLENIRKIGIAHILAISGLHLSILSGFIYIAIRKAIVIFLPNVALTHDTKKIATVPVFFFLLIYLNLSGLSISAIRSFTMISLFFIGILLDVKTCPIKILFSAFIVSLLINPGYLFHPSFQMSFIAVLALIQSYQFINNYFIFHKIFPKIISYIINIELSSIAATFATSFFEIYHFEQYSMIGLLSNPLILPIIEFFVLPLGFIGIFMPFSFLENYFYFLSGSLGGNFVIYLSSILINKGYGFFEMEKMLDYEIIFITIGLIFLFLAKNMRVRIASIIIIILFFLSYLIRTLLL